MNGMSTMRLLRSVLSPLTPFSTSLISLKMMAASVELDRPGILVSIRFTIPNMLSEENKYVQLNNNEQQVVQ